MLELLIATKNIGKFREMMEVFADLTNQINFVFLGDLEVEDEDFVEDGLTFAANARKKAEYYGKKLNLSAIGEDSGILVDAFPGELGVKTRRWGAGEHATDQEWITYFMNKMTDVAKENRGAKFVCSTYFYNNGNDFAVEAETKGQITNALEAEIQPGIPLSACFVAEGKQLVYSALSEAEKNSLSHRGKAMKKVKEFLKKVVAN